MPRFSFRCVLTLALVLASCAGDSRPSPPPPPPAAAASPSAADPATDLDQDRDQPTVAFLGDSISAGLHLAEDEAFPALLARRARAQSHAFRLINAGVSGDTAAGGLRRVDWLLKQHPDAVVVELGANDGLRGVALADIERNLRGILQKVRAAGAQALLLGMRLPPSYGADYVAGFEAIYPRLAAEFSVAFVPFFMNGVAGVPAMNLEDELHPTARGHERLADNVEPALRELLARVTPARSQRKQRKRRRRAHLRRRRGHRPALLCALIVACLAAGLAAGCGYDECDRGDRRCSGRTLQTCEKNSCHTPGCVERWSWSNRVCDQACAQPRGSGPFCAVSDGPDPGCGDSDGYCDDNTAVECLAGFATARTSCDPDTVCAMGSWGGPSCALSSEPDPRCGELTITPNNAFYCDGDDIVGCERDFAVVRWSCEHACAAPSPGYAFCAASSQPDPRCDPDAGEAMPTCPGGTPAACAEGGYLQCLEESRPARPDAGARDAGP